MKTDSKLETLTDNKAVRETASQMLPQSCRIWVYAEIFYQFKLKVALICGEERFYCYWTELLVLKNSNDFA